MFGWKVVCVLVATTVACNAFVAFAPQDTEIIYHYKAAVTAGTQKPVPFGSQFFLEGKLHVQAMQNVTLFKLTDLHYKIYNGRIDHVHEHVLHEVPLPPEMIDLTKVFKVVYDQHGHVVEMMVDDGEKHYVTNIKKSIASVWQLDLEEVTKHDMPHAFFSVEDSVYGLHDVMYNVVPGAQTTVQKMHQLQNIHDVVTNVEFLPVEEHIIRPFSRMAQHEYVLTVHGDSITMNHIDGVGEMFYYPFEGHSEAQFVYVNHTFLMMEAVKISEPFHVEGSHVIRDLTHHMFEFSESGVIPDVTNGRKVVDWAAIKPRIETMLKEVHEYLQVNHVNTEKPDHRQSQLVNRLVRLMQWLDGTKIEDLHHTLDQKLDKTMLKIFYHVLPMVGTEASTEFMKKLVLDKTVEHAMAMEMMMNMPDNVLMPTRRHVQAMEELVHSRDKLNWNVHKAAVLAFSSLVHKAYTHEMYVLHKQHHYHHDDHVMNHDSQVHHDVHHDVHNEIHHGDDHSANDIHQNMHHYESYQHDIHHVDEHSVDDSHSYHYTVDENTSETEILTFYERYITEFVEAMKQTQNKDERMMYMNALHNMKIYTLLTKHLVGGITGKWWPQEDHMRFMAMWAVRPLVQDHPEAVHKLFWPILMNHQEHTVMRMFAYHLIMESHPSQQTILAIYWMMMKEPHADLYNFHYTYFDALMHSTEPSHAVFKDKARQLMNYMPRPVHGMSSYRSIEFKDKDFNFGTGLHSMLMEDDVSMYMAFYMTSHVSRMPTEDLFVSIKIHGVHHKIADLFKMGADGLIDLDQLISGLTVIPDDAHVEVVVSRQQRVVSCYHIGKNSVESVMDSVGRMMAAAETNEKLVMLYNHYFQMFVTTDVGMPVMLEYLSPVVHRQIWRVQSTKINNVISYQMRSHFMRWTNSRQGLTFYNPVLDVWQGINKYVGMDTVQPMSFDISVNVPQNTLKVSMNLRDDNDEPHVMGLKYHVSSMVFVKDDLHRELVPEGHQTGHWVVVSQGDEYRHNFTVMHHEDLNTALETKVEFFDTEGYVPSSALNQLTYNMFQPHTKYFDTPLDHAVLYYMNWHQMLELSPHPGTYGLMARQTPSAAHAATTIDMTARLHREVGPGTHAYAPEMKLSTRLTYAVKNQQTSLKTWDVSANLDMNDGHTVNEFKVYVTRIIPGQTDYKVCMEGEKKFFNDEITARMTINMGQSSDARCVTDDAVIDMTVKAVPSEDQRAGTYRYGACRHHVPFLEPREHHRHHTMHCMADHTNMLHYGYDISTANVPSEFVDRLTLLVEGMAAAYFPHYHVQPEHDKQLGDAQAHVDVVVSTEGDMMDVFVYKPQKLHSLTGMPMQRDQRLWMEVMPDSTVYPVMYKMLHPLGLVNHCDVYRSHLVYNHHHVEHQVPEEWTMYVGDVADGAKHGVYVKHVGDDKMAIKVVHESNVLEVVPHEDVVKFMKNGQEMVLNKNKYYDDWVKVFMIDQEDMRPVVIYMPHFGFNIEYDMYNVYVTIPKMETEMFGVCYTK